MSSEREDGRTESLHTTGTRHQTRLVTLVFTDLVNSVALRRKLGDQVATSLVQAHRQLVRRHLARYADAREIETAGDSFLLLFERPSNAASFALAVQSETRALAARESVALSMRIGIHVGEVVVEEHTTGHKPTDLHGTQADLCARVMGMADGGQILVTRTVFESAKHALEGEDIDGVSGVQWVNHGRYLLKGIDEPIEVFEVGDPGAASLKAPRDSEKGRREVPDGEAPAADVVRKGPVTLARVIAAVVTVAALTIAAVMSRQLVNPTLNPNVVAIAPFTTYGEPLSLWREGMMDVLSRALDGVGELRAVSPTLVVRSWKGGRTDPTSVAEMARANGAGLAVFGEIMQRGPDSVRARVTLFDVTDSTRSLEFEVRDDASRMDRVSDSIAVRLFNLIGRTRSVGAAPTTALGSHSLTAIKAFLRGEQVYRRNDVVAARAAFEDAVAADTTFALAYRRLRLVLRFFGSTAGSTAAKQTEYAHRAGALNHGLGRRDSLMILADSLIPDPLPNEFISLDAMRRTRRHFKVLEQATIEYPDDPEVWAELGAARARNTRAAPSPDAAFATIERAIATDSLFGAPYQLAIPLALQTRGPEVALSLARRFLVINPNDTIRATVAKILRTDRSDAELADATRELAPAQLQAVAWLMSLWVDDKETGVRLFRTLARGPQPPFGLLGSVYRFRGHVREAHALADTIQRYSVFFASELLFSSRYEPTDAKALDSLSDVWLTGEQRSALPVAITRAADRRDAQRLTQLLAAAEQRGKAAADTAALEWAYVAQLARAYLSLVRGDSAAAAQAFIALPDSLAWGMSTAPAVMDAARLLTNRGRGREALALLDRHSPKAFSISPWQVVWHLEVARAAASTGNATRARSSYARGAAAWVHGDPALLQELKETAADMRRHGVR